MCCCCVVLCCAVPQMAKMLDLLEAFLNLHGHTYMRLDGSTKPEARQVRHLQQQRQQQQYWGCEQCSHALRLCRKAKNQCGGQHIVSECLDICTS